MIVSFTDFAMFNEMVLKKNRQFDNWEININDEIEINGIKYIVVSVFSIIYNQILENSGSKGLSVYTAGDRHEFNFEVVYYVDEAL